jgi:hypothetical protein
LARIWAALFGAFCESTFAKSWIGDPDRQADASDPFSNLPLVSPEVEMQYCRV